MFLGRLSRKGLRHVRLIKKNHQQRLFSESSAAVAAEDGRSSMGLASKFGLFSTVVLGGGGSVLAFMISKDEDLLFELNDKAPFFVNNIVAPIMGLPITPETGELDIAAYGPRDVSEVVGSSVSVVARYTSGHVEFSTISSLDFASQLFARPGDSLSELIVLEGEEASSASSMDNGALERRYGTVRIPDIPEEATKKQLKQLFDICDAQQVDLRVQLQLGGKYGVDSAALNRGLASLEARKQEIQALIKKKSAWW